MENPMMKEGHIIGNVSRRQTRAFTDTMVESQFPSRDESERDDTQGERSREMAVFQVSMLPKVYLGRELSPTFPVTEEAIGKHVVQSLQIAQEASTKRKMEGRPLNFGTVLPNNIYRSSFPLVADIPYLETLGLKTVLSLVKKDFGPELQAFLKDGSISHRVIDMPGTKKVAIPTKMMSSIMEVVLDTRNYPLLIHCNHGKHRTGCAVAVVRHVTGWKPEAIIQEYEEFAMPKVRECDVDYIMNYQISTLEGLFVTKKNRQSPLTSERMTKLFMLTVVVISIWVTTFFFW